MTWQAYALDLVDEPESIAAYEDWHRPGRTPGAVIAALAANGVRAMEIYRSGDRLFMLIDTDDSLSDAERPQADTDDPDVRSWIALMARFQKSIGDAEGWSAMAPIFRLSDHR